jgi:hypothetical protein
MARCVTCGSELHPERAAKYNYCTRRECQKRNAKGLKILAVGVNKAADQYEVLDGRTRAETAERAEPARAATGGTSRAAARPAPSGRRRPPRQRPARSWTKPQQELARIRNDRGMRPDEIARDLGLSTSTVIEMLLAARSGH